MNSTLLVGFDSAWTATNRGAIAGAVQRADGSFASLGAPKSASFPEARAQIETWRLDHQAAHTLVMLDQPTIVKNSSGRRPVEDIVSSAVGLRYGGMQPANTGRADMFGGTAPVWSFVQWLKGPADPFDGHRVGVFETYPVLALIAFGWTMPDRRPGGRLPKYNPERRATFALADWQFICGKAAAALRAFQLSELVDWLARISGNPTPRKGDQDGVDALLCLLVALHMARGDRMLAIGDTESRYIVGPYCDSLAAELKRRCEALERNPAMWVRMLV